MHINQATMIFSMIFAQCLISDGLFARQKQRKDKGAVKKRVWDVSKFLELNLWAKVQQCAWIPTSATQTSLHFYTKITLSALSSHCPIM